LTTRIYAQIYTGDISKGLDIMYECALVTMVLVFIIILVVHVIIPYYFKWKNKRASKAHSSELSNRDKKHWYIWHNKTHYVKKIKFNFNRVKLLNFYYATS
jgi:hypothetical protein